MDWNMKSAAAPIWDFTEFPPQETTTLPDGPSSATAPQSEFSVDLKLGRVSNGGVVVRNEAAEKSVGPTKRARGGVNNVVLQAVASSSCLVDGCYADLSNSREYHRRHKVCELHSKTPEVTIGGHKQRFCQQCSRFHSLEEFDEGKRSCRKRLEGHNRRRRKAQPDPLIRPPVVNCPSNYQGTSRESPSCFSNTNQIYSSAAAAVGNQHIWLGGGEAAAAALYSQQLHCFHNLPTRFGGEAKSFELLQGSSSSNHHNNNNNNNNNTNEYYCEGQVKQQQDTTDCALSLLSSPSPLMMQLGLHQGTSSSSSSSCSSSSSSATAHCNSLFDHNSPPQTLPFHWD